jgi:hypothetical protein
MSWSPAGKKGGDQPMTGFFFAVFNANARAVTPP